MKPKHRQVSEDPLLWVPRVINKLHSLWMVWTYPFYSVGKGFWAHHTSELRRSQAPYVQIGSDVNVERAVWLNIPYLPEKVDPILILGDGCRIGRRCMISAQNRIEVGPKTLVSPSVLLMDHNHAFENVNVPIMDQGNTRGGTIRIEEGCWIGYGATIVCSRGELIVGKNSVIGANATLTRSVPAYSVVIGNPGRVVRRFDPSEGQWVSGSQVVHTV
jgi:acetyltransferase-like isoleucine patch superfamily enzyme